MLRRCVMLTAVVTMSSLSLSVVSAADDLDKISAETGEIRQLARQLGPRYLKSNAYKGDRYVAERLVDGENFYRIKDYQRAAIIFLDIIENYPAHAAYPDALFLYADSLFLSQDYLSAKTWFKQFVDAGPLPGAERYRQKAIARLIEIAIHLESYGEVDQYFGLLGEYPTEEARYVKGKYLYFKKEYEHAKRVLGTVSNDRLLALKSRYLTGVILTLQGKYTDAVDVFKNGQVKDPKNQEEAEIVDLMNLGAGRLYYEQGYISQASECYQKVKHTSPYFDAALYEAASVLIQAGDTTRAEQTLEVLTVAVPDSAYLPRARMLRGHLLLRAGRYEEAEKLFEQLVDEYTPMMTKLDTVIEREQDTRQFFAELVESSMASLDISSILPPLVVKWVGEEPDVERALGVAKDLGSAKGHVKEIERLIKLLEAVVDGPSAVNAIPLLRQAKRKAQELTNRLGQLRGHLVAIADDELGGSVPGLSSLDSERQMLDEQLRSLPTDAQTFKKREQKSAEVYRRMRRELQRNTIRLDRLSAMAVALERFVADKRYIEGASDVSVNALKEELLRHKVVLAKLQEEMDDVRSKVDQARYQIGIGDAADRNDAAVREKMRSMAKKAASLVRSRGGRDAGRIEAAFKAVDEAEGRVLRFERELDVEAETQVNQIRAQVREEQNKIAGYQADLNVLRGEAEEVVGGVAFENFTNVRQRFRDLVLKADVGIIDVAWLKKENHTSRITEFTESRVKELKRLDETFQDIKSADDE